MAYSKQAPILRTKSLTKKQKNKCLDKAGFEPRTPIQKASSFSIPLAFLRVAVWLYWLNMH